MISTLGVFYIRRTLMPVVDLGPSNMGARIKTSKTGAGDTNYMNGRRFNVVTKGLSQTPTRVKWSPDAGTVTGHRPIRSFVRPRMSFPNDVGVSVHDVFVPKTGARSNAREPGLMGAEFRTITETSLYACLTRTSQDQTAVF